MLNQHAIGAAHHTAAPSLKVPFTRRATAACRAEDGQGTLSTTNRQVDPANAAILARLAKAKQYKSGVSETASAPAPPPPAPPPRTGPSTTDWGAMTSFLDSQGRNSDTSDYGSGPLASTPMTLEEQQAEEQRKARFAAASNKDDTTPSASPDQQAYASLILTAKSGQGKGSATQAAPFLQAVLNGENTSQDAVDLRTMSMEQFTEAKEQRRRQLGAEILTVDPNYRATQEGEGGSIVSTTRNAGAAKQLLGLQEQELLEELQASAPTRTNPISTDQTAAGGAQQNNDADLYAPKVSTWGVFPRPKDMSKEYGGGRNILPGQELETPEQKAKREAAYAQALRSYRAKAGLEVDQEAEAEAEVMYNEGMAMFLKADLQGAYLKFKDVLDVVPLKSKFGGLAGLQAAIILDSQGLSDKAKELYRKLQGHAVTAVSRKSKQMLFGFEASKFLKADTISYAPKKGDFDRYFRPVVDRNTVWVPTEEERLEDERAARQASLIAVAVLVGPIAMIGALIAKFGS